MMSERKRPRREPTAVVTLRLGQRVRCKFEHDAKFDWFDGTLSESRPEGFLVQFDDSDAKVMSRFSITPIEPCCDVKPKVEEQSLAVVKSEEQSSH